MGNRPTCQHRREGPPRGSLTRGAHGSAAIFERHRRVTACSDQGSAMVTRTCPSMPLSQDPGGRPVMHSHSAIPVGQGEGLQA